MKLKKLAAGVTALALSVTALVTPLSENFSGILDGLLEKISYSASAGRGTCGDWKYYENDDGTIFIDGYTGSDASVTIPSEINGGTVTGIYCLFENSETLTSVTIPDTVKEIGWNTFYKCVNLTSVTIPDSVTTIGENAFGYAGITSVEIGNSVEEIGKWAFEGCTGLTSVTIPDSVKTIGETAFVDCTGLTSIDLGNGVTTIYDWAFEGCTGLESISIPESVTDINARAFRYCSMLASINVSSDNKNFCSVDGVMFSKDKTKLIKWPVAKPFDEIPDDVTAIDDFAFADCTEFTSISIPERITSIGMYAFLACTNLTSVTILDGIKTLNEGVFRDCTNLSSISIPDSITSIGNCVFWNCSALEPISIPDNVTNIGGCAFLNCSALETITIPERVTSIGGYAFYGCSSLKSIAIPESVTTISESLFAYCLSLETVTIPDGVTSIGNSVFSGCTSLTSLTIPDSVTSIGSDAFSGCSNLTIKCNTNSTAHQYAIDNEIPYILLDANPANVTGLKMTANTPNSISMSWNKVSGATGYVVYQAIDGKWQRTKVTSGNTLTVSNLKAGTNYKFTVKAYKTVSGTNYYSPSYTGVWMTTLPAKPAAKMTVNTPQAIRLEWGKVTGATGYVVYQQVNGSWVKKAVTTNNVYVATGLKSGTNYNFAVRAYRTFNGKNYYSPFATATDTIKTCTKPATVSFTLTAGTKKATVNWSKVTGATGYIVYYKTSANGSWQKLTTTTGTTFTKTGLTTGKTYYFTVKAYKTYNGKTYNASFTTKSVKVK